MPAIPSAAKPGRRVFDPWNSSSTGHQCAENRMSGSTSWGESRTKKLAAQFRDQSRGGGECMYDSVGAGALGFGQDGRTENGGWDETSVRGARGKTGMSGAEVGRTGDLGAWLRGDKDGIRGGVIRNLKRERNEQEAVIRERETKRRISSDSEGRDRQSLELRWKVIEGRAERHWTEEAVSLDDLPEELRRPATAKTAASVRDEHDGVKASETPEPEIQQKPEPATTDPLLAIQPTAIFRSCVFYINGSTMPLISDHRMKFLISQHGGLTNIALGRNTVTHVVLGTSNSKGGVGGGLSASKIQKEIDHVRGKGVKFVGVEWLLESIKARKRLSEARFAHSSISTAPTGVKSVYGMFKHTKSASTSSTTGRGR